MFLNPALGAALDNISERAADARRAFTPGAVPRHDDVATPRAVSDFTLDPLAVSAPEGCYFVTRDEHGVLGYTRDGAFAVRSGRLVDAGGRTVSGLGAGGELIDLQVDPVDDALGRAGEPHIERDGTFAYERTAVDPRSGAKESQRVVVGRVALARFPAGTRLSDDDGSHVLAPDALQAHLGRPGDGEISPLIPMHRDRSRVDLDASLIRLKEAYMVFDALQSAEASKAHLGKTVMDLVK